MRVYLPATLAEIADVLVAADGQATMALSPRRGHALTGALTLAYQDEDEESLEFIALLAAADDDLELLAQHPAVPQLRLVLTLEVPDDAITLASADIVVLSPSAIEITKPVERAIVVCAHVDEPEAQIDIKAALTGDDKAVERIVDRDLLWYDTSEFADIPTV